MAYELKALRRPKIRYNSSNDDNPIVFQLVVDGAKVTPTSATIAIDNPSGTEVLSATAMTKSGSLLTYSVDTTTVANFPLGTGYRADIVVTYSTKTYERQVMFDVVTYFPGIVVSRDQLVDRDDNMLAAEHAGDENLAGLIIACHDELQLMLEARAFDDSRVLEDMILDRNKYGTVARLYILSMYHRNKRDDEMADEFKSQFEELWPAFLASVKYDKDQDGSEQDVSGPIHTRLVL